MNPRPSIPFDEHGKPVLKVDFDYPDEVEPGEVEKVNYDRIKAAAVQYADNYIGTIISALAESRGVRAKGVTVEAAAFVRFPTGETVKHAAKRLKVSRKHFSNLVNEWRERLHAKA